MSRKYFVLITLLTALVTFGCLDKEKSDVRFKVDPAQMVVIKGRGFAVPGAEEVDLVENMAGCRNSYRESLNALVEYYRKAGDAVKLGWAQRELAALEVAPMYRYLMPAESAYADLRAIDSIAMADEVYQEAIILYKQAGELLVIKDETKLRAALNGFNRVIDNYQTSDKIDDAAYRAGQIYEHFKDYEIAAVYYQRAFQWNEDKPYPARFRAAYILDKRLHQRKEALLLYQLAIDKESRYPGNTEWAKERIWQLTQTDEAEAEAEGTE